MCVEYKTWLVIVNINILDTTSNVEIYFDFIHRIAKSIKDK
jgi:hypothetical protein